MPDLLKVSAVFLLIVTLLRKKISMNTVMPIGSAFLATLYLIPIPSVFSAITKALLSPKSLDMTITLMLTMVMEHILRTTGMLNVMVSSLSSAISDRRVVMAAMPAMIGMLPSPGGAVFSAPMVQEAASGVEIPAEQKSLINYWYRHIWEYVSPLYPGIILVSGLTGLSTQTLFLANLPFAVTVVVVGALLCFNGISAATAASTSSKMHSLIIFFATIAPIISALLLVVVFKINPGIALGSSIIALYIYHRFTPAKIFENLKKSISLKALFLVLGIMIFQEMLAASGAVAGISSFFVSSGLPPHLVVLAIPFIAGIMTGLTVGFVGITFPLLMPFFGYNAPSAGMVALAFGAGFAGVMLSPIHLCYLLTCEYFGTDISKVYRSLYLPSLLVLLSAIVPLLIFR